MSELEERYDLFTAAAWIIGHARHTGVPQLSDTVSGKRAGECTEEELLAIVEAGRKESLKLYPFKTGTQGLQRVRRVMGFLHSISFETMLDVGSGRGVFLFPFLRMFPWVPVVSLDILERRVALLNAVRAGGVGNLTALNASICDWDAPDASFDVVTLLEVLEHIPDVRAAAQNAVRLARQYVVVTVPSKPDGNPEHIHLLTKDRLTELFGGAGCADLRFDGVPGHLFMVASLRGR